MLPAPLMHLKVSPSSSTFFLFEHHVPFATVIGTIFFSMLLIFTIIAIILCIIHIKNTYHSGIYSLQSFAWIYAFMFLALTFLTYIPGLSQSDGTFAGLFKLDLIDDLLHFGSAVWSTFAAWTSRRQAAIYFKIFGVFYAADGVIGLFTQRGYLDLGIWTQTFPDLSLASNIGANLPHILIGGIAIYLGFVLANKKNLK